MLISPLKAHLKPPRIEGYFYGLLSDRNVTIGNSLQLIETEERLLMFLNILGETLATPADPGQPVSPTNPQTLVSLTSFDYTVSGKNRFDKTGNALVAGSLDASGNEALNSAKCRTPNKIKVMTATAYIASVANATYAPENVFYYDSAGNFISYATCNTSSFTTPSNCHYIKMVMRKVAGGALTADDITAINNGLQIEKGSTATSYEAYQGVTASITLKDTANNQLENRGIPATYNADGSVATWIARNRIIKKSDGKWYLEPNVLKKSIVGTETIAIAAQNTNYVYVTVAFSDIAIQNFGTSKVAISNKFASMTASQVEARNAEGVSNIWSSSTSGFAFCIASSRFIGGTPGSITVQNVRDLFAAWNTASDPLIAYGVAKTVTDTELCAADQTALASVEKTFAGITNIMLSSIGQVQVEQWSKSAMR